MEVTAALEAVVKPRLEDAFGKGIAMLIVVSSANGANLPLVGLSKTHYTKLIKAICCDHRVMELWGDAGAEAQEREWAMLLD